MSFRNAYRIVLILSLCVNNFASGQDESDVFRVLFTHPLQADTLLFGKIDSIAELNNLFEELFPFKTESFYTAYDSLQMSEPTWHADSLLSIDVILGAKSVRAYSYFKPNTLNSKTAIFIVPGSGHNQSGEIFNNVASNYHNKPQPISQAYRQQGDVYLYIKPNEDILAFHNGVNKLNWYGLYPHLINEGRAYSSNYLIQCLAYIKMLKEQYERVVVVGLSQGGHASLLLSLISEPTASVVSSGYSILLEDVFFADLNQILITDLATYYNKETIKEIINRNATYYLFSWGTTEPAFYGIESRDLITYKYLQDTKKVSYYNQQAGHLYPPFTVMNNFFEHNNIRPILSAYRIADCENLSESIVVRVTGELPVNFKLASGNDTTSYEMTESIDTISFMQSGEFALMNPANIDTSSVYSVTIDVQNHSALLNWRLSADDLVYDHATQLWRDTVLVPLPLPVTIYRETGATIQFENGQQVSLPQDVYDKVSFNTRSGCEVEREVALDLDRPAISAYPNPFNDHFKIEVNEYFTRQPFLITIFDRLGRKISETTSTSTFTTIDLSNEVDGVYYIKLMHSAYNLQSTTFRLLKR